MASTTAMPPSWATLRRPAGSPRSVTKVCTWLMWPMRTGAVRRNFGAVGHQDHVARIGDDGLRRLDLAVVEIEQRAVLIDRRCADDGEVDLELLDEVVRRLADHRAVGAPDRRRRQR